LKIKAKTVLLFKYFAHRSYKYNYDLMFFLKTISKKNLTIYIIIFRPVPSSMPSVASQVDKADRTEVEVVTHCDELQVNKANRKEVDIVNIYTVLCNEIKKKTLPLV
jgi:hypothetical protein